MQPYHQAPMPQSTQNLMRQSPMLKCLVISTIIVGITVVILSFLTIFVDCSSSYSCDWYFPGYSIECGDYVSYCCRSGYSYCGDYYNCYVKPYEGDICWGFLWGIWIGCGIMIFMAIGIIVIALQLRRRNQQAFYNQNMYYNQPPPVIVHPQNQNYPNGPINYQNNQNNGNYDYQRM